MNHLENNMQLTSPAFANQQPIPKKYAQEGENISPPLVWRDVPPGTKELALIVDDPDAPDEDPFVHWVAYHIASNAQTLPEGASGAKVGNKGMIGAQGENSYQHMRYDGPNPPEQHGIHHYRFQLYALDAPIHVQGKLDKETLMAAMSGHVLTECELVGTYKRGS